MGNVAGHEDQIEGGACNVGGAVKGVDQSKATPVNKLRSEWEDNAVTRASTTKSKVGRPDFGITTKKEGVHWEHTNNEMNRRNQLPKIECGRSRRSQRVVRSVSTRTRILRQDANVFGGESTNPGTLVVGTSWKRKLASRPWEFLGPSFRKGWSLGTAVCNRPIGPQATGV